MRAVNAAPQPEGPRSVRPALCLVGLLALSVALAPAHAWAAAPKASCSPCHDQLRPSWTGSPHEAAGRSVKGGFRCQECHTGGLLHPTAVNAANAVARCGRCHWAGQTSQGKAGAFPVKAPLDRKAWTDGKHGRAKVACTACHSIHRYAEGADQHLLRQAGDALCRSCHPQPKHQAASDPGALARQPCVDCHDPHGSEVALLDSQAGGSKQDFRKAFVHKPVAEKKCNDCHTAHIVAFGSVPPEDEEEEPEPAAGVPAFKGLLLRPGRVFCYLCHDRLREKFEASGHARIIRFKRGEEQSPCLGCHLPHASEYARLVRYEGNQLCLSCHPGYAPHHFLARGGVKQSELKCVKCHSPHGTGNRRLLVQTDVCKMCHRM